MQIYKVGGAVRDRLLGRPVTDIDWVVVGANSDEMLARGYRPVGADFPVFLHPQSGEEYALARTERKSGRGYGGFTFHASPEVTLEEDLTRRDLTIRAREISFQLRSGVNACNSPDSASWRIRARVSAATRKPRPA